MPSTPDLIEDAFVAAASAIPGVESAVDHEPEKLPRLPAVTMLFRVPAQVDAATGPVNDVTWSWTVSLYLPLRDYRRAQQQLKELAPAILRLTRADPTLGGTCDQAIVSALDDDPVFSHDEGWMVARFRLTALSEEPG
jgi:hypothetical protein